MEREIGSIFEMDKSMQGASSRLDDWITGALQKRGYDYFSLVSSGRDALSAVIGQIQNRRGKARLRCLLPMYTCDTVIIPFERTGAALFYYSVKKNMQPDCGQLEKSMRECRPDVVAVHAHYGVDTLAGIRPLLKRFQEQGGIVIEDFTQGIFMPGDGQADYCVASLRKWLGIPDGGIILSRQPLAQQPKRERADFVLEKWEALTEKKAYLEQFKMFPSEKSLAQKQCFLEKHRHAERLLDACPEVFAMSQASLYLLNHTDFNQMRERRAENAAFLWAALKDCSLIVCPLQYMGQEAPLYFPVYVDNQARVQQTLAGQDIYVPILWPVPEQIDMAEGQTDYIYRHMLALPCDQRYDGTDMARVADCLLSAAAKYKGHGG